MAVGYWILAVVCWLLAIGYWLLAIGYWLLAIGCCLSAIGRNLVRLRDLVNELNDATGFYLLRRLSKLVAQRKDRRQKYHERQKNLTESICRCCDVLLYQRGWCCAQLVAIRGRRGRRPMICFLAFFRSGEGQRAAQLPAGSFDTGEGQRSSTSRGSRCRFIK